MGPACVYIQLHVYSMYMYIFIQDIIYCIYIIYILGRTQEDRKRAQHLKNGALVRCIRDNCTDLYTALFINVAIFVCYRLAELVINGLKMVATAIFGREKSGSDHAGWESFRYLCKYDSVFLVSNKT